MRFVISGIAGLIFGIGLIVSGMADPLKVQNFLDLFGTWDPSLAFVMGGAIAVVMPGFWMLRKIGKPVFAKSFSWPTKTDVDGQLLGGASIFGLGWGMSGFCPGPAITAVPLFATGTLWFIAAMVAGMWLANLAKTRFSGSLQTAG